MYKIKNIIIGLLVVLCLVMVYENVKLVEKRDILMDHITVLNEEYINEVNK